MKVIAFSNFLARVDIEVVPFLQARISARY